MTKKRKQNPLKKYYGNSVFLANQTLNKEEKNKIKNGPLYNYLVKDLCFDTENIFIVNVTSFSKNEASDDVRIRSDAFLKQVVEGNEKSCCIAASKINENKTSLLLFMASSFFGYRYKTNGGNSFINFDIKELKRYHSEEYDQIEWLKKQKKFGYFFYTCVNFDINLFKEFLERTKFLIKNEFDINSSVYDRPIPEKNIILSKKIYDLICGVAFNNNCDCVSSYYLDWKKYKETQYNILDNHHFIPKEYFKKNMVGIIDWDIIHDPINLIPLCSECHKNIHKGSKNEKLVNDTFDFIIKSFKRTGVYSKFIEYMTINGLDKNRLKDFYLRK